jgi:preprotein translocase subunit YajC
LSIPALVAEAANFIAQVQPATNPAATTQPDAPGFVRFIQSMGIMFPLLLVMILFIWMSSRSRKRQEQVKLDMLGAMKRGDRVQTIGGILGNVVEVKEDRILLKVDESNNTKVWFARSAIHRVLGGEETEAK